MDTYKIFGFLLSSHLTWNVHIEYIVKKANKRLYALRTLKKAGVQPSDLVGIYRALIRSVLEYAVPVWSGLPVYLSEVLEAVQGGRCALSILTPIIILPFVALRSDPSLTAAMPFALNLYLRLGHHLLSAIFSRTGPLLTMVINYVQASSALSMLKATRRDLTILLLYVFSKVYMIHHCNSGVLSCKSGV